MLLTLNLIHIFHISLSLSLLISSINVITTNNKTSKLLSINKVAFGQGGNYLRQIKYYNNFMPFGKEY